MRVEKEVKNIARVSRIPKSFVVVGPVLFEIVASTHSVKSLQLPYINIGIGDNISGKYLNAFIFK